MQSVAGGEKREKNESNIILNYSPNWCLNQRLLLAKICCAKLKTLSEIINAQASCKNRQLPQMEFLSSFFPGPASHVA